MVKFLRMKADAEGRPPHRVRRILVSKKLILKILFLIVFASLIPCVISTRPKKECKQPVSDSCVSFDPDPEPVEYADIPPDNDPFWSKPENEAVTHEDEIKFSEEDRPYFHMPHQKLYRYFKSADIAGVSELFEDAKFDLIEWPGRRTDSNPSDKDRSSFQDFLQDRKTRRKLGSLAARDLYIPLNYQAPKTKFLGYLCNPLQGTYLRAVGFRMNPDSIQREYRTYIPFYMTAGDGSFNKEYIQPLFALSSDLNRLAKDNDNPLCQPIIDGIVPPESKLTHIYDFTYTNGRLLLGMYCGILLVMDIDTTRVRYERALLNPAPDSYDENAFGKDAYVKFSTSETYREQKFQPINMISASTCCPQQVFCARQTPLAAAYSYDRFSEGTTRKFLYVSTDLGHSFDRKVVSEEQTVLHLIRGLYTKFFPGTAEPAWVTDEILRLKNLDEWVDNDPISEGIINPHNPPNVTTQNGSCLEIVSMEVLAEQQSILALCRLSPSKLFDEKVDSIQEPKYKILPDVLPPISVPKSGVPPGPPPVLPRPPPPPPPPAPGPGTGTAGSTRFGVYAVFELKVSKGSPLIPIIRKTKRKLGCKLKPMDIPGSKEFFEPRMVRSVESFNLFILGCQSVIYHSVNGGLTFWNVVFYKKYETGHYRRFHFDDTLDHPIEAFDPTGHSLVFCSGDWYAFGQINYNREFRMLVSRITKNNNAKITFESVTKFLPYYSNNRQLRFSFVALHILRSPNADPKLRALYTGRNSIRLIDYPVQLSESVRPYYSENLGIHEEDKRWGFGKCPTFSFSLKPKFISFDLNEKAHIDIKVEDAFPDLPLGIYSSQSTALKFGVHYSNHTAELGTHGILRHEWTVDVTAKGKSKTRIQRRSDAFFGSEYSAYQSLATYAIFTTLPQMRCHVQPSGSVYIDIGCAGKILVAHEDYHRPQCPKFFKNYRSYYKKGDYDEDLMNYWLENRPHFYKKFPDGLIEARFDYETFGCPIQPYRLDSWAPDLRILDLDINKNASDTMAGNLYDKSYVLIEVHGAGGFTYTMTNKQAGCVRPPQILSQMLDSWKRRRRVLQQGFVRYRDFRPKAIDDPINIWNRINYRPCQEIGDFTGEMSEELNNARYQIMKRPSTNVPEDGNLVQWKNRGNRTLFVFAAFEVDPNGTYCEFRTYFAVTIIGTDESEDWLSFLRFFVFFLILLLLVLLGYYCYRSHLRRIYRRAALYTRLEKAAWQILYRYERFVNEVEMHGNSEADSLWANVDGTDGDFDNPATASANAKHTGAGKDGKEIPQKTSSKTQNQKQPPTSTPKTQTQSPKPGPSTKRN